MANAPNDARASIPRVAKWLLDKGRPNDAVNLLSAWAASGPNDKVGQDLLAEAFRIDPSATVARMAFERMEGIKGEHAHLEAAIVQYQAPELAKLETEMKRPSFRRAQVGFNNNVKYRDKVFHVQTEDSGLDKPHIITHLFADGGRVIKSHKRIYAAEVNRPDVTLFVRALMKGQHMEMVLMLREGKFDLVIDGKAMGGMTVMETPPNVEVKRLAKQRESSSADETAPETLKRSSVPPPPAPVSPPAAAPATATPPPNDERPAARATGAETISGEPGAGVSARVPQASDAAPIRFRLNVLRSVSGSPSAYEPHGDEVILGSQGQVALAGERFSHAQEGTFRFRDSKLWVEGHSGGNGIFLRIRTPCELELGDEFIVGDQLLRVLKNAVARNGPDSGPTYFYSSPTWISAFRIVQIFAGGAEGACVVARGSTLVVGSATGDLLLRGDPLVGEQHCMVEEQAGTIVVTDLGSRTGVFVRIRGEQEIVHGDELLVGRTRLAVSMANTQLDQSNRTTKGA
jgi:hypothetical protein